MKIVNMLWLGDYRESVQQCIDSFARFHPVTTWGYSEPIYKNCTYQDAAIIMPRSDSENFRNVKFFSDWFRVNLMHEVGGWWSDCDNYCLKPLDFMEEYVFTYIDERNKSLNNSIFKTPVGSDKLQYVIDNYDKNTSIPGYLIFSSKLKELNVDVLASHILCATSTNRNENTYVVHLFDSGNDQKNLEIIHQLQTL